jgi:hypothetical protein
MIQVSSWNSEASRSQPVKERRVFAVSYHARGRQNTQFWIDFSLGRSCHRGTRSERYEFEPSDDLVTVSKPSRGVKQTGTPRTGSLHSLKERAGGVLRLLDYHRRRCGAASSRGTPADPNNCPRPGDRNRTAAYVLAVSRGARTTQ